MFPSALTAWGAAAEPAQAGPAPVRHRAADIGLGSRASKGKAAHGGRVTARRPVPQPRSNSERGRREGGAQRSKAEPFWRGVHIPWRGHRRLSVLAAGFG